tara:strand:+ start:519 stop:791 length:273 start_codon:yes stop_codon:yes gene_type:complete
MDIELGEAYRKANGNIVKVTLNEFREIFYLHIREYVLDGDTGHWFPTKSGYALLADEVSSVIPLLIKAENIISKKYKRDNQLSFDFGESE